MGYRSTTAVADILGIPYHRLAYLIRTRAISRPARDDSGDYVWSESDIEAARAALAARRRPTPAAQATGDTHAA